jgi:hypothetical protein
LHISSFIHAFTHPLIVHPSEGYIITPAGANFCSSGAKKEQDEQMSCYLSSALYVLCTVLGAAGILWACFGREFILVRQAGR